MIDPETPIPVLRRFNVKTLEQDYDDCTVVASMPLGGMRNPLTGLPSVAGLAILVDDVAGRANFFRRGRGQWTVSSELTVELNPDAAESLLASPDEPVIASARPLGLAGPPLLAVCTLTHCGAVIGGGTVHTMPVNAGPGGPRRIADDPIAGDLNASLAQLMAVDPLPVEDGIHRLHQRTDPMINNLLGIVHGGVSSAGLELVASAAINSAGADQPMRTASIRVNFLRPFVAGAQSVYAGTALRVGRSYAVGDARAVGDDGKVAVIARVTGYR
ncbi:PaaI family thioesterase [Mycolicibacterium sp.]|uniref:PaaI family thioesterase n=1 Tax=Mycolicibacterium sp. TaxID=2320850 RepID=UPI0025EAF781|nr:PaaI family thioesterase [Mycolicibacterium sp.]